MQRSKDEMTEEKEGFCGRVEGQRAGAGPRRGVDFRWSELSDLF